MSTLIVDELITELVQELRVDKPIELAAFRPWIYAHNNPAGNFRFEIHSEQGFVTAFYFDNFTLKTALGVTQPYYHGRYAIAVTPFRLARGTYTIRFKASGYTYSPGSFIGWCKDIKTPQKVYGPVENYTSNPYSFTLIEYRAREL